MSCQSSVAAHLSGKQEVMSSDLVGGFVLVFILVCPNLSRSAFNIKMMLYIASVR